MIKKFNKLKKLILPSLLIVLVAVMGIAFLGKDSNKSLKTKEQTRLLEYNKVEAGDEKVEGFDQITFDAFFLYDLDSDGQAEGIRGTSNHVNDKAQLWLELKVLGDITLKDATIEFVNSNVILSGNLVKGPFFAKTLNSTNITSIPLSTIGNGTSNLSSLSVSSNLTNDITSFNGTNKVILKGTVVDNEGNETKIEKEISYEADWYYDSLSAYVGTDYETNYEYAADTINVTYNLNTYTKDKVLLKGAYIKGQLAQLNGYDPIDFEIIGTNISYTYDEATKTFEAKREAVLDENIITTKAYSYINKNTSYNDWKLVVKYPKEANLDNANVPLVVSAWYQAYGNQNEGYEPVITSNVAEKVLVARYVLAINDETNIHTGMLTTVTVGQYSSILAKNYISKTNTVKFYNQEDGAKDLETYKVNWNVYVTDYAKTQPINMAIVTDVEADKINGSITTTDFAKYKTVAFSYADRYLGPSGYIKLINNDTDEVIHVFTALDWNNIYTIDGNVTSVRIETSNVIDKEIISNMNDDDGVDIDLLILQARFTKEIDNRALTSKYSYEEFETFDYISSSTQSSFNEDSGRWHVEYTHQYGTASYNDSISSNVELDINKTEIEVTEPLDVKLTLEASRYYDIVEGWIDGEFLVVLPKEFLDIEIDSITSDNNRIIIDNYEVTMIDGKKCIRIITSNENMEQYKLTINAKLTPDARTSTGYYPVKVYAVNPYTGLAEIKSQDIYDVDQDNDKEEFVNYNSINVRLISPTTMITTTTLKHYDSEGNTTVSPMIGEVNPVEDDSAAEVSIGIKNNSGYTVEKISIIGKLGFVGNTYQIGEGDLGSEFDVTMTNEGITVPTELEGKVKVYYSEKPEPTEDISDTNNGWVENPSDFSKIKTYMVIIDDYQMPNGKNLEFSYGINMPNLTANLMKKTYFTHGVYYDVVTGSGTYSTSVGGSKLGIMMARKYDLKINNYKTSSTRGVYARYSLTDSLGNTKFIATNQNGEAIVYDLYVGEEYSLKQINIASNYEVDTEEKIFKVENDTNDSLVLDSTGTYRSINYNQNNTLEVVLDSEPKYNVIIKNTDLDTDELIEGTTFKITGKGYESGAQFVTTQNGEIKLNNLSIGEEYTIEEIRNLTHLKTLEPFVIKLVRNTETGEVEITVQKLPELGDILVHNSSYIFKKNTNNGSYTSSISSSSTGTTSGKLEIDLTEFKEKYKLSMNLDLYSSNKSSTFKVYVSLDDSGNLYLPSINLGSTNYSGSYIRGIFNADKVSTAKNGEYVLEEDIVGGKKYYTYLYYYKGYRYGSFTLKDLKIEPVDGTIEGVATSQKENVPLVDNPNILQSINDSNNQDSPVLTVEVKSKKVPTYTLELTKKDASSKDILAGAQYKITGPGLPVTGKYLTTDEDGKATVELYMQYDGNYNNIEENVGVGYEQVVGEYTIEEVVAPIGYLKDNNSVTFTLYKYYDTEDASCGNTNGVYLCDSYEPVYYVKYNDNTEGKFKEESYNEDENVYNVVMEDYPIAKIVKKDSETGQLLPNTLFAIYSVEKVNGVEVLTPAKDVDGNLIGDEIVVNGKPVRVVATDSKGEINFSLSSGGYKVVEIQAADEKYEISDKGYYFGIGETVPYQASGISLVDGIVVDGYKVNSTSGNSLLPTSDGGYLISHGSNVTKYSSNFNVEWTKNYETTIALEITYRYFDDPDRVEVVRSGSNSITDARHMIETSDGNYAILMKNDLVLKIDKDGNIIWRSKEFYEGLSYIYQGLCPRSEFTGTELQSYQLKEGDDENYYCQYSGNLNGNTSYYSYNYYGSYNQGLIAPTSDGGILLLTRLTSNQYSFMLADGTIVNFSIDENGESKYNDTERDALLKFDKDGNMIEAININKLMKEAEQKYREDNNLTATYNDRSNYYAYHAYLGVFPDGSILYSNNYSTIDYGNKSYVNFISALKLDKNYEPIFYTPIAANGYADTDNYSHYDGITHFQLLADGSFVAGNQDVFKEYNYSEYFSPIIFDVPKETFSYYGEILPMYARYMFKFDKNGNPVSAVEYSRDRSYTDSFRYEDRKDEERMGRSNNMAYYALDDGSYIIAQQMTTSVSVKLASGEIYNVQPGLTIYKVNSDSSVEWIKQYTDVEAWNSSYIYNMKIDANGRLLLLVKTNKTNADEPIITEVGSDDYPLIYNQTGASAYAYLVFELNDEITPEGPEAYTININNSRKEYKIDITTDVGGEVTVKNGDNTVYSGTPETTKTIEKVKYGDDNLYDITIKPIDGYVITKVTVNGEDIGYTVNDDLSVTIDKIKDIKEDKNIEVSIERGLSTVIVHHYLENTKEKAFSDELLTGMILTPYETEAKVSNLYSLITDSNGEYIIPENYKGMYTTNPIEVVYYYKENNVDLKVNYYVNETEIELAPSLIETKVLGAKYQTSALDIEFYELARVIGEEEGTLDKELTEVTYLYNELTEATIKVKHVDKETEKEIAPSESFVVDRYAEYETKASSEIPVNYRYVSRTSNAIGKAESDTIEVIYYYEVIPFNVEVDTKIDTILINGEKTTISDNKLAKIEPEKTDNVIVYYEVTVKNTGDIKATMKLEQSEIEGFEIYDLKEFTKEEDKYVINLELEAGEEVTYKIGYKWNQERYGESDSITKLVDVKNSLGFEEPNNDDNISETKLIVGVKTGMNFNMLGLIIGSIITSGLIVFMILRRRIRA